MPLALPVTPAYKNKQRPLMAVFFTMVALGGMIRPAVGQAPSMTDKDVQIVGKTLGFLDPPVTGGVVAVVYVAGNPAAKADADAITAAFGGGVKASGSTLTAKAVAADALGDGSGYVALIAASGAAGEKIMNVAKAHKLLCLTGDLSQISNGGCVVAIKSDPKVEITVNHAMAVAAGIDFAPAFRMMIKEQ